MKIGAKSFSARVYLSYVNDKLEQYARKIIEQGINLKGSEEESKKSSRAVPKLSNSKLKFEVLSTNSLEMHCGAQSVSTTIFADSESLSINSLQKANKKLKAKKN